MSDRIALLERYGRIYGELGLAIAFTETIDPAAGDPKRIRAKGWEKTKPLADGDYGATVVGGRGKKRNPAVVLRPSNLIGVECDTPERLEQLLALGLPDTVTVQSSEAYKLHFWFRPPNGSAEIVAFRFEERLEADRGRYLLVPPAVHPSGAVYTFLHSPEDTEIATLPQELYDELVRLWKAERGSDGRAPQVDDVIPEGRRNGELASIAGTLRRRGLGETEIAAALLETNRVRCQPPLEEDEVRGIAASIARYEPAAKDPNQDAGAAAVAAPNEQLEPALPVLPVEPWRVFAERATEHVPCLVDELWPEGSLGFIAAPPKCGKTWIGISLGLSVATGRPLFGRYAVPEPRPVLYVALEGHRAALRARVGCMARGLGLNPDCDDLDRLAFSYKPRGIDLADVSWAAALARSAADLEAGLIVVDVLRAAARIRENESGDFARLRDNLSGLLDEGRSLAMLHHFGKLSETNRERAPGERMAGSGAMQGALDVGLYVVKVEGGRVFHLEVDQRDFAAAAPFAVRLAGVGSGPHGGFTYVDTVTLRVDEPERETAAEQIAKLDKQILSVLRDAGDYLSKNEIHRRVGGRKSDVLRRVDELAKAGVLDYRQGRGFAIAQDRFPDDGNHPGTADSWQPGQPVPPDATVPLRSRGTGSREPVEEPGGSHDPEPPPPGDAEEEPSS